MADDGGGVTTLDSTATDPVSERERSAAGGGLLRRADNAELMWLAPGSEQAQQPAQASASLLLRVEAIVIAGATVRAPPDAPQRVGRKALHSTDVLQRATCGCCRRSAFDSGMLSGRGTAHLDVTDPSVGPLRAVSRPRQAICSFGRLRAALPSASDLTAAVIRPSLYIVVDSHVGGHAGARPTPSEERRPAFPARFSLPREGGGTRTAVGCPLRNERTMWQQRCGIW